MAGFRRIAHTRQRNEQTITATAAETADVVVASLGEVRAGLYVIYKIQFEAKVVEDLETTVLKYITDPVLEVQDEAGGEVDVGDYTLISLYSTTHHLEDTEVVLKAYNDAGTTPSSKIRRVKTVTYVLDY